MRRQSIEMGFLTLALGAVLAAPAFAQDRTLTAEPARSNVSAAGISTGTMRPVSFSLAPAAQGGASSGSWRPLVFGGFISHAGTAFTIGGGAVKSNFLDNEKYALQIDAAYNKFGDYSNGCDFAGIDCSSNQFSFSGAFLYNFKKMDSGWQPYAGGGIVIIHTSVGVDDDDTGFEYDASFTDGGIQVQGGLAKVLNSGKTAGVEVRIQGAGGGGFALLGRLVF